MKRLTVLTEAMRAKKPLVIHFHQAMHVTPATSSNFLNIFKVFIFLFDLFDITDVILLENAFLEDGSVITCLIVRTFPMKRTVR